MSLLDISNKSHSRLLAYLLLAEENRTALSSSLFGMMIIIYSATEILAYIPILFDSKFGIEYSKLYFIDDQQCKRFNLFIAYCER